MDASAWWVLLYVIASAASGVLLLLLVYVAAALVQLIRKAWRGELDAPKPIYTSRKEKR